MRCLLRRLHTTIRSLAANDTDKQTAEPSKCPMKSRVGSPPEREQAQSQRRAVSPQERRRRDSAPSPLDPDHSSEYLTPLHLGVCLSNGVPFDQQSNLVGSSANTHHSMYYDSVAGGAVEDYVVNAHRAVADRTHIQDIAITHERIHARTTGAEAHRAPGSQEFQREFLELMPLT
jgi:hypothetical protein